VTTEETNMLRILERKAVREIQNNKNVGEHEQKRRWGTYCKGKIMQKFIKSL
jgi:hypothetical protein